MKKKGFVVLAVLSCLTLLAVYAIEMNPHNFPRSKCPTCHVVDAGGKIVKGEMTGPMSVLCGGCHRDIFDEGYMHPMNVRPGNVTIPADMPLSNYGEITCATCHDIHSSYLTLYGASTHYLRRGETGKNFCFICHPRGSFPGGGHEGTLGEAHFTAKYMVTDTSQELDKISQDCISCHDGSFATSVTIGAGIWRHSGELMQNDMGSHPIGMDYEMARTRPGNKSYLRPMGMVDRRIRFFDGKVGCGSCHDPYSSIEQQLVMSDENSRLCLACHTMDRRI